MRHITPALRRAVFERDNYTCMYCGACGDDVCLEIDHIIPVSRGGNSDIRNLVTACEHCNRSKQDKLIGIQELRELAVRIGATAEYLADLLDDDDMRVLSNGGENADRVQVSVYLSRDVYEGLKALAQAKGLNLSDMVARAANSFFERNTQSIATAQQALRNLAFELASKLAYLSDDIAMDVRESLYEPDNAYAEIMQRLSEHLEELGGLYELYGKKQAQLDTEVA